MSVTGTVAAVDRSSWGDHVAPALTVLVTPDRPTSRIKGPYLGFKVRRPADGERAPIEVGDHVTVPVETTDGHVLVKRRGVDLPPVRMLGGSFDPCAPKDERF